MDDNVTRIQPSDLLVGMTISHSYAQLRLSEPAKVQKLYRDHEGAKALLRDKGGDEHTISLADDEDYGAILLYKHP